MPKPYTILRTEENFKLYNYRMDFIHEIFNHHIVQEFQGLLTCNISRLLLAIIPWESLKKTIHIQCLCLVFIIVEIKEQMVLKMTWKGKVRQGPEKCVFLYPSLFPDTNSDTNLALSEGRPEIRSCIHPHVIMVSKGTMQPNCALFQHQYPIPWREMSPSWRKSLSSPSGGPSVVFSYISLQRWLCYGFKICNSRKINGLCSTHKCQLMT